MSLYEDVISSPGSPPGMTASKSSKSSSLHSIHSDDNSVLADVSHYEEIGLEDDADAARIGVTVVVQAKIPPRQSWSPDLRPEKNVTSRSVTLARPPATSTKARPGAGAHLRVNTRPSLSVIPGSKSTGALPTASNKSRSPSPTASLASTGAFSTFSSRRISWQSAQGGRKSVAELERECDDDDDDDDDDIPEYMILSNVPISPRPPTERSASSRGSSPSPREKARTVGSGTPPTAHAQGSLKSPASRPDGTSPLKTRARSWNAAMAELNAEAKALTEKLEEHAQELEDKMDKMDKLERMGRISGARPKTWQGRRRSTGSGEPGAPLVMPPFQRSIMIDPLPISREKEAVLSRTRPSWLPPKNPVEEKKHLREYQRMMAHSAEMARRKEAERNAHSASKEATAGSLMKTWEQEVIPRWDMAIRERKTRQLWWKGVPPRSRGVVWQRAIGNPLELTETSYQAALGRAHQVETRVQGARSDCEDGVKVAWFNQIRKDVSENTWADLRIFQPSGPLHQSLVDVLCAYAMYRSDIGYIPGCHTIAALLLLNLASPPAAFIALANLLNRPLPLSFYAQDLSAKASAYNLVMQGLSRRSEALHFHLTNTLRDIDPDEYLGRLFRSIFTGHLSIDESARLWDVYVFEGDSVLVRAAIAILLQREMALLGTKTAADISDVLARACVGTRKRAVGEAGSEDKWIESVKEAGR